MAMSARLSTLAHDTLAQRRFALLGLVVLMIGGLMLSACNTTAGAGQDVKATGNAITRSADDVKSKL
jgi:predicted small secreted protein